jgi:two-component system sensor histidine kinase UhpB
MRFFCLIVAILLFKATAYGQEGDDSAMIKREQAAYKLTNTHPDSAFAIAVKDLQQSLHAGNKKMAAYSYKTKGWALFRLGNADSCLSNLIISTDLFLQLNDTVELMYNYLNLANVYSTISRFNESAHFLMKSDSLAKMKNDIKLQAGINKQMGVLYREQGQYNKAIPYFKESMEQYLSIKDTIHIWDPGSGLSTTYNYLKMYDSNLVLLKRCASLINALKGYDYQKAYLNEKFGDVYFALLSYTKALDYYKLAYTIFASDNNSADMAFEAINVGKSYQQAKKYGEAEKYLLQAYRLSERIHMTHYSHDAAKQLSDLYKTTNDWQKGFKWLAITSALNDSLSLTDQNEKAAELQAKYETEKKDKEISLLKKDQQLKLLTLQKQETFRYGTVIVITLLVLIAFLIINRYRVVHRARQQIEIEKLRNNIARDLHDDMGSALSSINIISKVVLENPGEKENIQEHFKKIHENSGYMLESMSDIVWAINPANDAFEKVLFKMKEFASDILEPLNMQYEFIQSGELAGIQLSLKNRKDLYLIFKEAINNVAKYSHCTKVTISISHHNSELILQVTDNGSGFDTSIIVTGNGLNNMKQRAAEMSGSTDITSERGKGTTVQVRIKSHD